MKRASKRAKRASRRAKTRQNAPKHVKTRQKNRFKSFQKKATNLFKKSPSFSYSNPTWVEEVGDAPLEGRRVRDGRRMMVTRHSYSPSMVLAMDWNTPGASAMSDTHVNTTELAGVSRARSFAPKSYVFCRRGAEIIRFWNWNVQGHYWNLWTKNARKIFSELSIQTIGRICVDGFANGLMYDGPEKCAHVFFFLIISSEKLLFPLILARMLFFTDFSRIFRRVFSLAFSEIRRSGKSWFFAHFSRIVL